jgi:rod shape-determining protein MreD
MPWAIFGGLVLDLLSQMPPGTHLLALAAVTFLADLGHRVMQGSTALFAGAAVLASSILYGLILVGVLFITRQQVSLTDAVLTDILPGAAYNLVVLVPVFLLQRAVDNRFPVPVIPQW